MDPNLVEANQKIEDALEHTKKELSQIRAGRANPSLLEEIPVDAYGGKLKMMEVGTIAAPQPSLLTIQVWDVSIIRNIEKAILESNLGLNPAVEGTLIRVPIPPLSEERRLEFVKLSKQKGEETKIQIRQIRQEIREGWEALEKKGEIGEDELHRRQNLLQDLIDKTVSSIDELIKAKEDELMQV